MSDTIDSVSIFNGRPPVVQISDIHGYLKDAKSSLLTLAKRYGRSFVERLKDAKSSLLTIGDTDQHSPIITVDDDDKIHWADNDYVLVINGDVIDRGPKNEAALKMVWRLMAEAPDGRVQYHIGNHEMPIFVPKVLNWPNTYSNKMGKTQRESFLKRVIDGDVTAAFDGYTHVYSHAGRNEPFDPQDINKQLRTAAERLLNNHGVPEEASIHEEVVDQYDRIFELGEGGGRGPSGGLCWMDFKHMKKSAPPQIVGHSMHATAARKGGVICGNVIRHNQRSEGGEGVLMETPDEVKFFKRTPAGSVHVEVLE